MIDNKRQTDEIDEVTQAKESPEETTGVRRILEKVKKGGGAAVAFCKKYILMPKVREILFLIFEALITLLGCLQIVLWGLDIKDGYERYLSFFKNGDYTQVAFVLVLLAFLVVILVYIIKNAIAIVKKDKEIRFELVTTIFSLGVFSSFARVVLGRDSVFAGFEGGWILTVMLAVGVAYAALRLLEYDWKKRLMPLIFGIAAIVTCLIANKVGIGRFATIELNNSMTTVNVGDLNVYSCIRSLMGEMPSFFSFSFMEAGNGLLVDLPVVAPMQIIMVFTANILPFAVLALVGYLMHCMVDKAHNQLYQLNVCRRCSISILVLSVISVGCTIGLDKILRAEDGALMSITVDYKNVILTLSLCVLIIILTSIPKIVFTREEKRLNEGKNSRGEE